MKEYSSLQAEYKLIWTHNPKETWVPEKSIYSRIMSVVKLTTPPHSTPTSVYRTQATYHWFQVCCHCGGSVGGVCVKETKELLEER